MSKTSFRIELFDKSKHDRKQFDCGVEPLNDYLRMRANQDITRDMTACHVVFDPDAGLIAGFYTLAMSSVPLDQLPQETAKRLPRYPAIPVVLMGRLAVDKRYQGQGRGKRLLADAVERAARISSQDAGAFAVVVEAKDHNAAQFYQKYRFIPFDDNPRILFLALSDAEFN